MTLELYTSYFGAVGHLLRDGFKPEELVSIARSPPLQFTGMAGVRSYKLLAPSWSLLNDWHRGMKPSEYVTRFQNENLKGMSMIAVLKDLAQQNETVVMLCYEPPGAFCHRHIVADWIRDKTRIVVEEWKI